MKYEVKTVKTNSTKFSDALGVSTKRYDQICEIAKGIALDFQIREKHNEYRLLLEQVKPTSVNEVVLSTYVLTCIKNKLEQIAEKALGGLV